MPPDDCITAPGWLIGHMGYRAIWRERRSWLAHRWAWTQAHGPIPEGMLVLHHCDNPECWNVDHLYLGTHTDNAIDRSKRKRHYQQQKTHCPQGHPYAGDNLRVRGGRRICIQCLADASRRSYLRKKARA